jgi:hypothetical protein
MTDADTIAEAHDLVESLDPTDYPYNIRVWIEDVSSELNDLETVLDGWERLQK